MDKQERFFPHGPAVRKRSGKAASACFLVALLLVTISPQVRADAAAQVRQAVEQHLRVMLEGQAARQGWQGMQLRYDINVPAASTELAQCSSTPQIQATGDAPSAMDRQQLRVSCPDGWSLNATGQAHVFLPVVHAEGIIDRGQTLTTNDLKLQRINIAKARRGYYNRIEEVAGLAAKRRIRAGQTITPALLEQAMAVKRGQPVKIVASHDGIEASTSGEALADGQPNDVIRVRNMGSGKVIDAKVIEAGVVTSTF
ncbi:flagellar basal body P-ring formation chaperone FlgA [Stutzerimonas stutzeri]|uniref:flagellar basal body P-ring formation chaperone FlgA n=1 Tax=Stutzerimonas stutzeri TaxID=316 RepID=UPI00210CB1C2|nr:flagellar basal body P-ring formation chaperone FlgA [Stutzerimonas stutzeri]MCQ4259988.1 flagellar basal body P-ring formation chaperone FlgA [Stutzerimonas stutzeri]